MSVVDSIAAARLSGPSTLADGKVGYEFCFAADDPTFAGHFPGHPIVPGVFQLEMTRAAAEWTFGCQMTVREVTKAKFLRPISPAETIRMQLSLIETENIVMARASLSVGDQPAGETILKLCRGA
jgi:3-hydroxymyristoyl/3-hydroxydecanoyl-(acyl carrier protein) dehydratase